MGRRYTGYEDVLSDPEVDAVHINSPIPDHGWMSVAALRAGKHVACTVPMATTTQECRKIVEAAARTGLKYMMMETTVYSREFLYIKQLYGSGELGKLQFLQATHHQDMDGWPGYWPGLPADVVRHPLCRPDAGAHRRCRRIRFCFGSGTIRDELAAKYGSPFAVETAHIRLRGSDLTARIYRSLFDTARQYRESIDVFGSKQSFEWALIEGERHVLHTAKRPERGDPARAPPPISPICCPSRSGGLRRKASTTWPRTPT